MDIESHNQGPVDVGESREDFLARVSIALENDGGMMPPDEPAPECDDALVRLVHAGEDLVSIFMERAREVGMTVRQTTKDRLLTGLVDELDRCDAVRVSMALGEDTGGMGIENGLKEHGKEIVDWRSQAGFGAQYEADAGITDVHAALAETGTLVCQSSQVHCRAASLVPPVHIAIVSRSDILPDMIDYWRRFRGGVASLPSSISLITGPSKTADIEGELVTGVHGPGRVTVLLVEDL